MRICFVARRVRNPGPPALDLPRELAAAGHEVVLIDQHFGSPPRRAAEPGLHFIGLQMLGERDGEPERDVDAMVFTVMREHERRPFDLLHGEHLFPVGWATLVAAKRLRLPCVISVDGGPAEPCCEAHAQAVRRVLDHAGALLLGEGCEPRSGGAPGSPPQLHLRAGDDGEVVGRRLLDAYAALVRRRPAHRFSDELPRTRCRAPA